MLDLIDLGSVWKYGVNRISKNLNFFFKIKFILFSDRFDVLMSKIIFKK
jgi:hypothetical protein